MQSDNENSLAPTEPLVDTIESSRESTLEWLMELDRDEPEENLFVVDKKIAADLSLSAYEAEVAARPMVRGRAGADDLDTYIGEEIVLSEPGGNDIYSGGGDVAVSRGNPKRRSHCAGTLGACAQPRLAECRDNARRRWAYRHDCE